MMKTNPSVHAINTWNKHQLCGLINFHAFRKVRTMLALKYSTVDSQV